METSLQKKGFRSTVRAKINAASGKLFESFVGQYLSARFFFFFGKTSGQSSVVLTFSRVRKETPLQRKCIRRTVRAKQMQTDFSCFLSICFQLCLSVRWPFCLAALLPPIIQAFSEFPGSCSSGTTIFPCVFFLKRKQFTKIRAAFLAHATYCGHVIPVISVISVVPGSVIRAVRVIRANMLLTLEKVNKRQLDFSTAVHARITG